MPYDALSDLPDAVKKLPKHGQEIYMKAFNAAFEQYNDEGKAAATAWAAVGTKYKKVGNQWVAKESHKGGIVLPGKEKLMIVGNEPIIPLAGMEDNALPTTIKINVEPTSDIKGFAEAIAQLHKEAKMPTKLSDKNKANLLQTALIANYGLTVDTPIPGKVSVEEVFDDRIIYAIDGQLYEATYEMGETGPTFGEPQKVLSTRIFKPMEALQAKYAEMIQEAGRRGGGFARAKETMDICQSLLAADVPDEAEIARAIKNIDDILTGILELPSVKIEEGVQYPSSAYAYVLDIKNPNTWQLRLYEADQLTRKQLAAASAALSPGGFAGQKAKVPSEKLSEVLNSKSLLRPHITDLLH